MYRLFIKDGGRPWRDCCQNYPTIADAEHAADAKHADYRIDKDGVPHLYLMRAVWGWKNTQDFLPRSGSPGTSAITGCLEIVENKCCNCIGIVI